MCWDSSERYCIIENMENMKSDLTIVQRYAILAMGEQGQMFILDS